MRAACGRTLITCASSRSRRSSAFPTRSAGSRSSKSFTSFVDADFDNPDKADISVRSIGLGHAARTRRAALARVAVPEFTERPVLSDLPVISPPVGSIAAAVAVTTPFFRLVPNSQRIREYERVNSPQKRWSVPVSARSRWVRTGVVLPARRLVFPDRRRLLCHAGNKCGPGGYDGTGILRLLEWTRRVRHASGSL